MWQRPGEERLLLGTRSTGPRQPSVRPPATASSPLCPSLHHASATPSANQVIHDHWTGGHRLPGVHPGPPPSCQSPAGCCYRGWGGVPWGRANDHTWDVTNRVIQYEPPQRERDTWSLTPQVPWHSPVGKGFCRRIHGSSVGPLPVLDWPVLQSAAQTSGQWSALGVKMYPPKFTC